MEQPIERPALEFDLARNPRERYCIPPDALKHGGNLLASIRAAIPPKMRGLADLVDARTNRRFHTDALALAEVHGCDWRDVLLANISYDLIVSSLGCSTVALPGPSGPVLARNTDWYPQDLLARASYVVRMVNGGQLSFAHAGWPASIGVVSGMSARGFALVLNAVAAPEGSDLEGYPVLLFLRRVLEDASDFDAALKMVTTERLAVGGLFTLVGCRNEERVIVERSPARHSLRWGEPGKPVMATNHYRQLYQPDGICSRYERLCELLSGFDATREPQDDVLLAGLSDAQVVQEITAQHVIIRPSRKSLRLFVPQRLLTGL